MSIQARRVTAFSLSWASRGVHELFKPLHQVVPEELLNADDPIVDKLTMKTYSFRAGDKDVLLLPVLAYPIQWPKRAKRRPGASRATAEGDSSEATTESEEVEDLTAGARSDSSNGGVLSMDSGADSDVLEDINAQDEELQDQPVEADEGSTIEITPLFFVFSLHLYIFWEDLVKVCSSTGLPFIRLPSVFLVAPLNRLNATLSLLHPLDRYRTRSAIGSAIERPLSRPISHPNTGGSPQPPRSKPLGGLNRAIVAI